MLGLCRGMAPFFYSHVSSITSVRARFRYERRWPLKTGKASLGFCPSWEPTRPRIPRGHKLHTLHATGQCSWVVIHGENEEPRAETDQVGHSSMTSFSVTCVVTSREISPSPTSALCFHSKRPDGVSTASG